MKLLVAYTFNLGHSTASIKGYDWHQSDEKKIVQREIDKHDYKMGNTEYTPFLRLS
jgi:hypothetical protein